MARALTLLVTFLAASVALAGCAEDPDDPGTATPTPGTPSTGTPSTGTPAGTPTSATPYAPATANAQPANGKCVSNLDPAKTAATPVWVLDTSMGTIRVALFCDKAPLTAQNFVNLTEKGHFDGTKFHRVIKDFMNQGGDPYTKDLFEESNRRWGTGGPGYTIKDEFYCANGTTIYAFPASCGSAGLGLKHDTPGVLSMANTGRPSSGGSQFFLTAVPTPHLDGKHAVFGHTADQASLDVVLAINKVPTTSDRPNTPVVIKSATIAWA